MNPPVWPSTGGFKKNIKFKKSIDSTPPRCYAVLKYFRTDKGDPVMMNLFAAFFYSYFYFFGFSADKVKVLFAANHGSTTFA